MTINSAAFEFRSDRVGEKCPADLGRYIAGMGGNADSRRTIAALVGTALQYDASAETEMERAFERALEDEEPAP